MSGNNSLQTRAMKKAVERVDIGAFGIPLKIMAWTRKRRSTMGGLIGMTLAQAAIGACVGVLAGFLLGVPVNALSMAFLFGMAVGSAIGGPLSFLLWTLLLIGVTGLVAGFTMQTWVASPSWWRMLAADWQAGAVIPRWFMIGVPVWMLFWVAAARGVSKVTMAMFDKIALRMGFRAAKTYAGEDKRVYDEAFEQSDVSQAESRSLLEHTGDGTMALVTVEASKMGGRVEARRPVEMGGDPDVSDVPLPESSASMDYDAMFGDTELDPDVAKVAPRPQESAAADDETGQAPPTESIVVEMEHPVLPAVPQDTAPPVKRIETPQIDPRSNRALYRRMSQLNLAFQAARHEDRDVEFVEKHHEELAKISDEQRAILDSMNDTGPLLALIHEIQRQRTEDFLIGKAPIDVEPGTGAIDVQAVQVEAGEEVEAIDVVAPQEQQDDLDAVTVEASDDVGPVESDEAPALSREDAIAAMAGSLSAMLGPRREAPRDDVTPPPADDVVDGVGGDDGDTIPQTAEVGSDPDPSDELSDVPAPVPADAAEPPVASETVEPVVSDESVEMSGQSEAQTDGTVSSASDEDGPKTLLGFDLALDDATDDMQSDATENAAEAPVAETPEVNSDPTHVVGGTEETGTEEEMNSRVFSRVTCRQVLGLVVGHLDASVKAEDIAEFERNSPDTPVAEVINSRSFDELVGSKEAAEARHAWPEIRKILSQSSIERLVADLERVNDRGHSMIEEPHTLTPMSFHAFETDSVRLRRLASQGSDLVATQELVTRNVAILDMLSAIKRDRENASVRAAPSPGGIVRQKVSSDRDDAASKGRGLIGSVLGGARTAGIGIMRDGKKSEENGDVTVIESNETSAVQDAADQFVEVHSEPMLAPPAVEVIDQPAAALAPAVPLRPGDEGFVSAHPEGSALYKADMSMHEGIIAVRQQAERELQEQLREEREREQRAEEERLRLEREEADRVERERLKVEQAERDRAEADRLRAEREADDERRRAAESAAAAEARRIADAETERVRREEEAQRAAERDRLALEAADADRRAREAEAERAALELARERSRTQEEALIIRQFHERRRELEVPERFRTEEVVTLMMTLAELRNVRKTFQLGSMGSKPDDMSDLDAAMRIPSHRSTLQADAEMARQASVLMNRISSIAEATDQDDMDHVRSLMEPEEIPFFERILAAIQRGRAAVTTLKQAEEMDSEIRAKAALASGVEALKEKVSQAEAAAIAASGDAAAKDEELAAVKARAETAERERLEAVERLEALRKQMAGIIDDDFQRILDSLAKRLDHLTGGIEGFYKFVSEDEASTVIVMTTPATTFPDGVLQIGAKSIPVVDFIETVVTRASSFATESVAVLYTDPSMRAYTAGAKGVTLKHVRRSVDDITSQLHDYGISIENKGE